MTCFKGVNRLAKLKKYLFIFPLVVIVLALFSKSPTFLIDPNDKKYQVLASELQTSIATPTIFIPGTNGTVSRFDGLLDKLSKAYDDLSVQKITVQTDGTLKINGRLNTKSQHPVFVIAFEQADDGIDALVQQGKWLKIALDYLADRYEFSQYHCVGHSNGGLVMTEYLQNFYGENDPSLVSLMTLGTPYNDVELAANSDANHLLITNWLQHYLDKQEQLPANLQIVNVAGRTLSQDTDGIVPLNSVLAGKKLYGFVDDYQEVIVEATHSELPENTQVMKLIIQMMDQEQTDATDSNPNANV